MRPLPENTSRARASLMTVTKGGVIPRLQHRRRAIQYLPCTRCSSCSCPWQCGLSRPHLRIPPLIRRTPTPPATRRKYESTDEWAKGLSPPATDRSEEPLVG